MTKPLLKVFDDDGPAAKDYIDKLLGVKTVKKQFTVEPLDEEEFKNSVTELRKRQRNLRVGKPLNEEECSLDKTAVFVIDYDLLTKPVVESISSGEDAAYLVRYFSKCGIIIGLNQFGTNPFDLTLRGHLGSHVDLNIGAKQIGQEGLWSSEWKQDVFRPWYWPNIINLLETLPSRIKDVLENFDVPLLETLGFEKQTIRSFDNSIAEYVVGRSKASLFDASFSKFVLDSGNGFKSKDTEALLKMKGESKDEYINQIKEYMARIAAARIIKWLERDVLSGQYILIDAPHLVIYYPSLLKGKPIIKDLNKTARLVTTKELNVDHAVIAKFKFNKSHWLYRPAWFFSPMRGSEDIAEVLEPLKRTKLPYYFCEDTSCFQEGKNCTEFVSEVASDFKTRYIRQSSKEVNYQPTINLFSS